MLKAEGRRGAGGAVLARQNVRSKNLASSILLVAEAVARAEAARAITTAEKFMVE